MFVCDSVCICMNLCVYEIMCLGIFEVGLLTFCYLNTRQCIVIIVGRTMIFIVPTEAAPSIHLGGLQTMQC